MTIAWIDLPHRRYLASKLRRLGAPRDIEDAAYEARLRVSTVHVHLRARKADPDLPWERLRTFITPKR